MAKKLGSENTDFRKIARETRGMLPVRTYQRYFEIARDCSRCSILELGAGQGAGTIALAQGIRTSGRNAKVHVVDQFLQQSNGPHPASVKTHGEAAVSINVGAFRKNLRNFAVDNLVTILVARTDAVDVDFMSGYSIDLLVIDVDGMIDRDLGIFYDHLPDGAHIVIDDYRNIVTPRGWNCVARHKHLGKSALRDVLVRTSSYRRRLLLGKHLLTYRLVNYFIEIGLIERIDHIGATLFCRKTGSVRFSDAVSRERLMALENAIVDEFVRLVERERGAISWLPRQARRLKNRLARIVRGKA